jgi:molybdenum cofactor cytidylyltransferase
VVLGASAADVTAALGGLTRDRIRIVRNADWQDGLSASLRCGLRSLPPEATAALIFLGDMPNVDAPMGTRALEAVANGAPAAYPVFAGQPGHPVAVSRTLFPALDTLSGDTGARAILANLPGVVRIETQNAGCIQDIDTQGDLAALA